MASATRTYGLDKGYNASAAVTIYRFVKMTGDETVGPITAAADQPFGVTQASVASGEITKGKAAPVALQGISLFEADVACSEGQELVVGASGNGTLAPKGTASAGTIVLGRCVAGAASTGLRGSVLLGVS